MSLLDRSSEGEVATRVLEAVDDLGLLNHELVSGILKAAFKLADMCSDPERCLDEGAALWADGFPEVEDGSEQAD